MRFLSAKYAKNAFAAPLGELTDFNVNMEDWKPDVRGWSMFVGISLSSSHHLISLSGRVTRLSSGFLLYVCTSFYSLFLLYVYLLLYRPSYGLMSEINVDWLIDW